MKKLETATLASLNGTGPKLVEKGRGDLYLNFSNTFEKVQLTKMLQRLEMVEMHHVIVNWIRECLSEGTHQVKVVDGEFFSNC